MKAFVCVKWKPLPKWGAFLGYPYAQSVVWPRSYSRCGDANTAMGELAVGRAAAPLVPNEINYIASSFGSSILILEDGTGGYFDQEKTIWWARVIRFMTNFACAIQTRVQPVWHDFSVIETLPCRVACFRLHCWYIWVFCHVLGDQCLSSKLSLLFELSLLLLAGFFFSPSCPEAPG